MGVRVRRHEAYRMFWSVALMVVLLRAWFHGLDEGFFMAPWWAELVVVPLAVVLWFFQSRDSIVWEPAVPEGELEARLRHMGYVTDVSNGPHVWLRPRGFFGPAGEIEVVRTTDGYVIMGARLDLMRFRNVAMRERAA